MERLRLLSALVENAIDGIITIDRRGQVESINPAALNIFGYLEQEVIGNNISLLMPEPDKSRHNGYIEHYQQTRQKVIIGKGREVLGLRKDGTTFPFRLAVSEVQYDDRVIYAGFIHDLSKQKEAEKNLSEYAYGLEAIVEDRTTNLTKMLVELSKAKEAVSLSLVKEKELNQMKTRFVSMASHEFRTPLSSVQLSAILIEKYIQLNDNTQAIKHVHKIKNSVASLNAILNDFLSLEKLEAGIVKANITSFDISEFAQEIAEEMQLIAKENQRIIHQHIGSEDYVYLDPTLLRNCLMNLISNAIKYSAENTSIYVSTDLSKSKCVITVKDDGIGIPLADQKTLFQPFFRAHNTGEISGTGLGLNIVQRYVTLMSGKIAFESKEGEGAKFTLSFPSVDHLNQNS